MDQKRIAIDLDDVLFNFTSNLIEFYNKKYKVNLKIEDINHFRFNEFWKCTPKEARKNVFDFYFSSEFENIKAKPEIKKIIDILASKHILFIITSRNEKITDKTKNWIENNFPDKFQKICFSYNRHSEVNDTEKTKANVCKHLNVDFLIEDDLEYAKQAAEHGVKVFLFDTPWNKTDDKLNRIERVYNWQEILEKLT